MKPVYCWPGATNRGVHFQPFGYHGYWFDKRDEWMSRLKRMHISWVVILSDGDAVTKSQPELGGRSVVQFLLDHGVIPVVRFQVKLNRGWPHMDHVRELVRQFAAYGLNPLVLVGNEPGDGREWEGDTPKDWDTRYLAYFKQHGSEIINAGGVALFADAPEWPYDPFPAMAPMWEAWKDGWAGFAGHWYGLHREPDWPRDSVTQTGLPLLTEQDLVDWFGPFYNDHGLNDVPLDVINEARRTQAQPGLTPLQDATCWRGWELVAHWMTQHFGRPGLMVLTEGGWTPGACAGSGGRRIRGVEALLMGRATWRAFNAGAHGMIAELTAGRDLRYLKPTPIQVADWTLVAMEADTPMLFQCPWLLGDSVLGGAGAWDMDAWVTGWWRYAGPEYWLEMPVIRTLEQHPPQGDGRWEKIRAEVAAIRAILAREL